MKILIVEDDKQLLKALQHILIEQKYMVDAVDNGQDALDYARNGQYDVILMDVMIPIRNGYEVVMILRAEKISTPILMLTAKDSTGDKVEGLNRGADDYMTKPFSTEELLARLNALTRRQGDIIINEMVYEDVTLNIHTCELSCKSQSVNLSYKEFEIMKMFLLNPKVIMTKETLLVNVWGIESEVDENNLEAYISFLRKKLKFVGSKITIKNRKKLGYRLEEAE